MKRKGRQHGMVRSYRILPSPLNPRPNTRFITRFDSPPTAGLFVKVSSKPTNHSKFTGKCDTPRCNDCHLNPACKSKDKTKGTQKHKQNWRVMDPPHSNLFGLSATETLDHLSNDYIEDEVEYEGGDQVHYHVNYSSTSGDCYRVEKDDSKCISEMGFSFIMDSMDQVEEEKGEDWFLVES
ncbi:uncharacterized protein LOC113866928 [Abrus precatorius]|uniref:Uncharacterized protein LOC113866928 n=1 Tax=Abrus precatorius TaxID=3816 RepID=A0A8B8LM98_ABRPR|nr:uncharacterized protein LOC113866928 [Abrus precatorius]